MSHAVSQLQYLLGITLEHAWVQRSVPGNVDRDTLLKAFLLSEISESSAGCLPEDWQNRPQLHGTFVLQLNEVVNIAAPVRDRYKPDTGRRCLKLHLTDGKTTAWAIELSPCAALNCNIAAGCKVILTNPVVHRGCIMLMGASIQCLGGQVQRLEAARQRLLQHWNKPLGCSLLSVQQRRTFPQLMQEATEAAWPQGQPAGAPQVAPQQAVTDQQQQAMIGQQQHAMALPHAAAPGANPTADAAFHASTGAQQARGVASTAFPQNHSRPGHTQSMCLPALPVSGICASNGAATPAVAAHAHPTAPPHAQPPPASNVAVCNAASGLQRGGTCIVQAGQASYRNQPGNGSQAGTGAGFQSEPARSAGPSLGQQALGQAMLPCPSRQLSAQHRAAVPSDRATVSGVVTGHGVGVHLAAGSAAMLPSTGAAAPQTATAPGAGNDSLCDVIMIDSDDDDAGPVRMCLDNAPATARLDQPGVQVTSSTMGVPAVNTSGDRVAGRAPLRQSAVLRSSTCNVVVPRQDESDDDAPLVSRPRKLQGRKHCTTLHCTGSENSGQVNRKRCGTVMAESMADADAQAKSHPGCTFQVAASFHYSNVRLFDDHNRPKTEYDVPGIIKDSNGEWDAVVKPEFFSACGLGSGPAHLIEVALNYVESNPGHDESQAPIYKRMDGVLAQLKEHGTLLLEWRHDTWYVSLPMTAVASMATQCMS